MRISTILALAMAAAASASLAGPALAATKTVTIENYAFAPAKLVVRSGDTITWVNHDSMPHTASALDGKSFDSGAVDPGSTWSFVFSKAGDYQYRCAIHPDMHGEIVVE